MAQLLDRFDDCAAAVMAARGDFTPHDPLLDGPAAHGVGLGLLSVWIGGPADVPALRALGAEGAARILNAMVWSPLGAARFAPGPDLALFAYAVEAGTMQAMCDLQRHLGVEASGAADAPTLTAAAAQDSAMLATAIAAAHDAWRAARGLPTAPTRRPAATRQDALAPC